MFVDFDMGMIARRAAMAFTLVKLEGRAEGSFAEVAVRRHLYRLKRRRISQPCLIG